jgi:ParB-like chromosome segregation protein Spo0J
VPQLDISAGLVPKGGYRPPAPRSAPGDDVDISAGLVPTPAEPPYARPAGPPSLQTSIHSKLGFNTPLLSPIAIEPEVQPPQSSGVTDDANEALKGTGITVPAPSRAPIQPQYSFADIPHPLARFGASIAEGAVGAVPSFKDAAKMALNPGMTDQDIGPFNNDENLLDAAGQAVQQRVGIDPVQIGRRAIEGDPGGALGEAGVNYAQFHGGHKIGPYIGERVQAAREPVAAGMRRGAESLANTQLRTRPTDFKFGKNPGAAILDENILALTKHGMLDKIDNALEGRTQQLEDALSTPEAQRSVVNMEPAVRGPFENAMGEAEAGGASTDLLNRLQQTERELTETRQRTPEGFEFSGQREMRVPPLEATRFKRRLAKTVRWNNQPYDFDVNMAKKGVYGGVTDAVNEAVPEAAPLNEHISDLIGADEALQRTINRDAGHDVIGLGDLMAAGTGAALGNKSLPGALALTLSRRISGSPAVMLPAAQGLDFLANRIRPGRSERLPWEMNRPEILPPEPKVEAGPPKDSPENRVDVVAPDLTDRSEIPLAGRGRHAAGTLVRPKGMLPAHERPLSESGSRGAAGGPEPTVVSPHETYYLMDGGKLQKLGAAPSTIARGQAVIAVADNGIMRVVDHALDDTKPSAILDRARPKILRAVADENKPPAATTNMFGEPEVKGPEMEEAATGKRVVLMKPGDLTVRAEDMQPRKGTGKYRTNPAQVEALTTNMKEKGFDQDHPIVGWKDPESGKVVVMKGHHRLEAAEAAKLGKVPVELREGISYDEAKAEARRSNNEVAQMGPMELAHAFQAESDEGRKPAEIAKSYGGMKDSEVEDLLTLNQLEPSLQQEVQRGTLDSPRAVALAKATMRHNLPAAIQRQAFDYVIKRREITPTQFSKLLDTFAPAAVQQMGFGFGKQAGLAGMQGLKGLASAMDEYNAKLRTIGRSKNRLKGLVNEVERRERMNQSVSPTMQAAKREAQGEVKRMELELKKMEEDAGSGKLFRTLGQAVKEGQAEPKVEPPEGNGKSRAALQESGTPAQQAERRQLDRRLMYDTTFSKLRADLRNATDPAERHEIQAEIERLSAMQRENGKMPQVEAPR